MRSEIVNNVLEITNLDKPIDGTKELRAASVAKDKEDVQKVKKLIKIPWILLTSQLTLMHYSIKKAVENLRLKETYLLTSVNESVNPF